MWRQIFGMSAYITMIMAFLFFFVDNIWDLDYTINDTWWINGEPTNKNVVYTLMFNTFIYLHVFNEVNCRVVKPNEFNVFKNITKNLYFIVVLSSIIGVQYIFVQWGGSLTRCAPLSGKQQGFCVLLGSTALLAGFLLKLVPDRWTQKIPKFIDENKKPAENDRIMKMYKAQAEAKITKNKK